MHQTNARLLFTSKALQVALATDNTHDIILKLHLYKNELKKQQKHIWCVCVFRVACYNISIPLKSHSQYINQIGYSHKVATCYLRRTRK